MRYVVSRYAFKKNGVFFFDFSKILLDFYICVKYYLKNK